MREILDAVIAAIDEDPVAGPKLRAAAAPLRLEFPDLKLALNIRRSDRRGNLIWNFSRSSRPQAKLRLSMDSAFANRLLQGGENPAIAIARGRLRTTVKDAGAALGFFGAVDPLVVRYRELIAEKYPHLSID